MPVEGVNYSLMQPSEENIDAPHSPNSETTEITKEFFENYAVLDVPWDDPSLYVEDNENAIMNEKFLTDAPKPYETNDRWNFLRSESSKNSGRIIKKKNTSIKSRISSQSSEGRCMSESSDCFTVPDYNIEDNSFPSVYQQLEENYQRQNYIHQKILQLQEEAYQLEYEAHFLQSTLYHQQQM
uniref:Uncharacterized protein n=1 Tax=Panagrolaimus davidi TaxID=227884 RepID=A0A914QFG9_9BILA